MVSKYRDRKINQSVLLVGNDIYTDATAKSNAKTAFDGNVVYNFETMVRIKTDETLYVLSVEIKKPFFFNVFRNIFWIIFFSNSELIPTKYIIRY